MRTEAEIRKCLDVVLYAYKIEPTTELSTWKEALEWILNDPDPEESQHQSRIDDMNKVDREVNG